MKTGRPGAGLSGIYSCLLSPHWSCPRWGGWRGCGRAGSCPLVGVGCHGNIPFFTQWEAPLSLPRGWSRQPHRWLSASGTWQPSLWQPRAQQQGPVERGRGPQLGQGCVCEGAREPWKTPLHVYPEAQVERREGREVGINSLHDRQTSHQSNRDIITCRETGRHLGTDAQLGRGTAHSAHYPGTHPFRELASIDALLPRH